MEKKITIRGYEFTHDIPGNFAEFTKRFKEDPEVIARLARKGYEKELRSYIICTLKDETPENVQALIENWQPPALSDPRMEALSDLFNRLDQNRKVEILSILTDKVQHGDS